MLKKRLVGVVTVKGGQAVQSFGYQRYLPLGRPEVLVENLDRWGVDEIVVQCIDRTCNGLGPDLALVDAIARRGITTPVAYGGGVASADQAVAVVQKGADRVVVDRVLHDNPDAVEAIARRLGAQAVVASVPVVCHQGAVLPWNYQSRQMQPFSPPTIELLRSGAVSEMLLVDVVHEGAPDAFNEALLAPSLLHQIPAIPFGGISTAAQMRNLLGHKAVAAVAVGNFLNYREHAVQQFKEALTDAWVRPAHYATSFETGLAE